MKEDSKSIFGFYIVDAKGKYIFGFSWLCGTENKSANKTRYLVFL